MAAGRVAGVDPEAFKIVDGKLYLGWSKAVMNKWDAKTDRQKREDIEKADEAWSKLKETN